jgi:hypothetical protein
MQIVTPLAQFTMVASPGGGVGKSEMAKAVADYYRQQGIEIRMFDGEIEQKTGGMLSSYFSEARRIDITTPAQFDEALRSCKPGEVTLLDLGAATGPLMKAWFQRVGPRLQKSKIRCTLIAPITASQSSVAALFDWANFLQDQVQWIIVKNEVVGTDFAFYDFTPQGKQFRELYTPRHITLKLRWDILLNELQARSLTVLQAQEFFQQGESDRLGPILSEFTNVFHLEAYSDQINAELETVKDLLLP